MSRVWFALVALLSTFLPLGTAAAAAPPTAERLLEEGADADRPAAAPAAPRTTARLEAARRRVEAHIAGRRLTPREAARARVAFVSRLLGHLGDALASGAVTKEEEREVRAFARAMLDAHG